MLNKGQAAGVPVQDGCHPDVDVVVGGPGADMGVPVWISPPSPPPDLTRGVANAPFNSSAPLGGWGVAGGLLPSPLGHPPPPHFQDWAKFSSGPLANQKFSLAPLKTQHRWGGAHPATFSTAPAHQRRGSANAETTPAGAPAAAADRTQRPDATCGGKNG